MNWVIGDDTTEPLDFEFQDVDYQDETVTPINLTGVSDIELRLKPATGGEVKSFTLADALSVLSAVGGTVRLSPEASSLIITDKSYTCYFRITDATGKIIRVPSDHNFELILIEDF